MAKSTPRTKEAVTNVQQDQSSLTDPFSFASRAAVGVESAPSTLMLRTGIMPTVDPFALSARTGAVLDDSEVSCLVVGIFF